MAGFARCRASTAGRTSKAPGGRSNGVVTDKRETNGRKEVEVEVWTENAAEQRTTPGRAVVVLTS